MNYIFFIFTGTAETGLPQAVPKYAELMPRCKSANEYYTKMNAFSYRHYFQLTTPTKINQF